MDINTIISKRPLIISGPCSVETPEQLELTIKLLKEEGKIDIIRAGIWKPRTRPGNFEGVGVKGLPWLIEVAKKYDLPTMIEVATPEQIELALAYGIDILWIGARTTVNPFSVQALADIMRKFTHVPILIKNPVNPDVELWQGAVERMMDAGVQHIGLIHRGFSTYGKNTYRNPPMWNLAVEMKRRFPNMLMINDPSHICGRRDILQEVAQHAIDLDFDGLMIESHCNPDEAWSDAAQQITPRELTELLEGIEWRRDGSAAPQFLEALDKFRSQIDALDNQLLKIIVERMKISESIGAYKKENNITILQTNRWIESFDNLSEKAELLGLSKEFIAQYYAAIHMESIEHQNKIMNN